MANILEYIISMKDKASSVADRVAGNVDNIKTATDQVNASTDKMQSKMGAAFKSTLLSAVQAVKGPDTLKDSVDDLREKLEAVNRVRFGTVLKSEFISATKEAKTLEKQIKNLENGISGNGISSKIKGWRQDFASSLPGANLIKNPLAIAGAAVGGFWVATQKAMDAGKEKMKLQTLTGSKEIGASLYEGLNKFATDTVFGTEVYDMGVQMLANGIKDADVLPLMNQLGDISMGDSEKLGSLSLAFAQISGKGKLAGQELLQLINAGFNPLQVLAEKTGESMESLQDRMSKGQIGVDEVRKAMNLATGEGGDFHNMLNDVANTPYGKMEGFKGQLEDMTVKIGEVFIPIISDLIDLFSWIGEKMGPYLKPIAIVIGVVAAALLVLAAAQWVVNIAMLSNPVTWIVIAIIALIAVIVYLVSKIEGWGALWQHTMRFMKLSGELFVDSFKLSFDKMALGIIGAINRIKIAYYKMKEALGLGDSSANKKMIATLENDTKQRAEAVLKATKDFAAKQEEAKTEAMKAATSLKWNEDVTLGSTKDKLMNNLGIGGSKYDENGGGDGGNGNGEGKKTNEAIATGGQRNTTINITMDNMVETISVSGRDFKDAANNMADEVQNQLMRVLAMASTTAG